MDRDDHVSIDLTLKIGQLTTEKETQNLEDYKVNGLFLQFVSKQLEFETAFKDPETLTLDGLVLMFISHHNRNRNLYHLVYKYFPTETKVKRNYISVLFDAVELRPNSDDSCALNSVTDFLSVRIQMDFEKGDKISVLVKETETGELRKCFEIPYIHNYVNRNINYFNIMTSMGSDSTYSLALQDLRVYEKKNRLDVNESLHVSHELMVEIFDKVKTFTSKFNADGKTLVSVDSSYKELFKKAALLHTFANDLFRGTRKFEEHVIENLKKYKLFNPENLPKMLRIKTYLETLKYKQNRVFQRFVSIKGLFAAKKVFKMTQKNLRRVDGSFKSFLKLLSSEEMTGFSKKMEHFMGLMKNVNLKQSIEDVSL